MDVNAVKVEDESDSLQITWTQPDTRCDVTNNTISWSQNSTGDLVDSETIDAAESYMITGLDPWTTYLVCVSASTLGGEGPEGACVIETTDEDGKCSKSCKELINWPYLYQPSFIFILMCFISLSVTQYQTDHQKTLW